MRTRILKLSLLFIVLSCKETPPGPPPPPPPPPPYLRTIDLTVVDTGFTDVYLRVKFLDTVQTRAFRLDRDGAPVLTITPAPLDTVVVQDSLSSGRTYTYKAFRLNSQTPNLQPIDSSLAVTFTTLDTTSHEFTFQTFQFGEHSSSAFYDVAIIDENNIWAVGEVYLRDSVGQPDDDAYNLARWDGIQWSLTRIQFPSFCGQPGTVPHPAVAIMAFDSDEVWIADVLNIVRWNGNTFGILCIPDGLRSGAIKEIWGESPNSVYVVGDFGTIVHYDGTSWQRVESGTTLHIYDVFGERNPVTSEMEVYAVAAEQFVSPDRRVLKLTPQGAEMLPATGIPSSIRGVWFKAGRRYWVVGAGMYTKTSITSPSSWQPLHPGVTQYYTYAIRGSGINDVAVCGSFGELLHYNGSTWRSYRTQVPIASGAYYKVALQGNSIIAVGYDSPRAKIALGRR